MGGLLGGMIFRNLGLGGFDWGEGFGLADILFILFFLGIIFFVVKLFRSRQTVQMSAAGAGPAGLSIPVSGPRIALPSASQETFENASSLPALQQIKSMDPLFSQQGFLGMARNIFAKIQEGWSRRDLNMISPVLSPQMLEGFQQQLDQLKATGQVNPVEKITVRSAEFADAGQDHGEEFIAVRFTAEAVDYLADENGAQVLAEQTRPCGVR